MSDGPSSIGCLDRDPVLRALPEGVLLLVDGRIAEVNEQLCALLRRPRAELVGLSAPFPFVDNVAGAPQSQTNPIDLRSADPMGVDADLLLPDGELLPAVLSSREGAGFTLVTVRDRSERANTRRWLAQERDFSRAIIASIREPYWLTVDGAVVDCNRAMCELVGLEKGEIVSDSRRNPVFWPPEHVETNTEVRRSAFAGEVDDWEVVFMAADGRRFPVAGRTNEVRDDRGRVLGHVSTARDLSVERRREAMLREAAEMDGLTGVLNARTFRARLEEAAADSVVPAVSLLLVDVDCFKEINDNHGHPAGDRVLGQVAALLESWAPADAAVGRLGGDEFAVLALRGEDEARELAERVRSAVEAARFESEEPVTVSVGVATAGPDGRCPDRLYRDADRALYRAKREGRNRVGTPALAAAQAASAPGEP